MDNWLKLKEELENETREYFRDKNINVGEMVDLLKRVLNARIDDKYQLGGVAVNIPKAMFDILDEDSSKRTRVMSFATLVKFEPFLRKILFLINEKSLIQITDEHKGLSAVLNALRLNPDRIDYHDEQANAMRSYDDYYFHLYRVYNVRNAESHL